MNVSSNHSKKIQNIRMQIVTIGTKFQAFECKFEPFEQDSKHLIANSNHPKEIRSTRIKIRTRKGFEAFESKFEPLENGFEAFQCKLQPFERHSNANLNNSKGF